MPTFVAVIVAAAAFLAVAVKDRALALAVFCGALPAYLLRFTVPVPGLGALPSTLLEVLFWELWIVWLCTDGPKPHARAALAAWAEPLTLFAVGATVGVLVAPDLRASLGLWRAYVLEPLLFFPLFVDVVTRAKKGTWVLAALAALTAAVGASAVYQKFTGFGITNPEWQAEATRRVTSVFGFPNAIGLLLAPIVVLLVGWAVARAREKALARRLTALMPAAAALLGIAGIVFAVSKGAMLGVGAGVLLIGLADKRLRPWALGAIIAGCVVVAAYPPFLNRAGVLFGLRDSSGSVRTVIWQETIAMLKDQPVFGGGLGGYPGRIAPYHKADWIEIFQYPHDLFLNFWTETGLLGLAGFLWIAVRAFIVAWRERRGGWVVTAAAGALLATLVHGLVDVPYFKNDLAFLFWIIVGTIESVRLTAHLSALERAKEALTGKAGSPWLG